MKMSLHQALTRLFASPIAALFLLVVLTSSAFGQADTGQIIGKVTDPSGAAVPGATVSVKSKATGAERTATALPSRRRCSRTFGAIGVDTSSTVTVVVP